MSVTKDDAFGRIAAAEAQLARHTRKSIVLWAVRWALGIAGAAAIVAYTGDYHWILPTSVGVAALSLGVILLGASVHRKRLARARTEAETEDATGHGA